MKGIVFTEFLELVEEKFGLETLDEVIEASQLESGGAYTSLGTYHYTELLSLVGELSSRVGVPVPDLVGAFGHHLIQRFSVLYPQFFETESDSLSFLTKVEGHIHSEVRKLYSEAELPEFDWEFEGKRVLHLTYSSHRPFAALAQGMIEATGHHYGDELAISSEDLSESGRYKVRFRVEKVGA